MPLILTLGPFSIATYTAALMAAIAVSAWMGGYVWGGGWRAWGGICVCVLVGGVLGGRLAHVLAHWDYFGAALGEAARVNGGGLDWPGAVVGGMAGAALATRALKAPLGPVLNALTPALPLLMLAGSVGCAAAACAYGQEIPTLAGVPPWTAAELPDVYGMVAPRYQTQLWAALWALGLLGFTGLLFWRGWLKRWRFAVVLALLTAGMAVISVWRA